MMTNGVTDRRPSGSEGDEDHEELPTMPCTYPIARRADRPPSASGGVGHKDTYDRRLLKRVRSDLG